MLDKEFLIKVDRVRFLFISGGPYFTAYDPPDPVEAQTMNSPFQTELQPDDEAVYTGTLQLYRNVNALQSVTIRDDYQRAHARFEERFGTSTTPHNALVIPLTHPVQ